jgi:hypothetical protein
LSGRPFEKDEGIDLRLESARLEEEVGADFTTKAYCDKEVRESRD